MFLGNTTKNTDRHIGFLRDRMVDNIAVQVSTRYLGNFASKRVENFLQI